MNLTYQAEGLYLDKYGLAYCDAKVTLLAERKYTYDGNKSIIVEFGHTKEEYDELSKNYVSTEDDALWDFNLEDLLNGAIEVENDGEYYDLANIKIK